MIGGKVINIDGRQALQDITALGVQLKNPQEGIIIAARAVGNTLKKHFRKKNKIPNARGFEKTGFWGQVRDSVVTLPESDGATVQVNDVRLNPHVFGAVITPKRSKALAIPVVAEAYGLRAATFDNLVAIRTGKNKSGNTIGVLAKKGSGKNGILQVMYVLVKRAVIKADPKALPSDDELRTSAGNAFDSWITRKLKQA